MKYFAQQSLNSSDSNYQNNLNINNYKKKIRHLICKHIQRILLIANEKREKNTRHTSPTTLTTTLISNNNKQQQKKNNKKRNNLVNIKEKFSRIASYIENLLYLQSFDFNEYSNLQTLSFRLQKLARQFSNLNEYSEEQSNQFSSSINNKDKNSFPSMMITKSKYSQFDPVFICYSNYKDVKIFSRSSHHHRVYQAEFRYMS